MKNQFIIAILCLTVLNTIFLIYNFWSNQHTPKVAVVQMERLVYEYKGMQEATDIYSMKLAQWHTKTDSLENRLQALWNEIKQDSINGNHQNLVLNKQKFNQYRLTYLNHKKEMETASTEEDQLMTAGVLNQIRSHMSAYAKAEGFDLIIANTQLENIAYVADPIDVTSALLQYANHQYDYGN